MKSELIAAVREFERLARPIINDSGRSGEVWNAHVHMTKLLDEYEASAEPVATVPSDDRLVRMEAVLERILMAVSK